MNLSRNTVILNGAARNEPRLVPRRSVQNDRDWKVHWQRSEGSFATGAQSKDPVSFTMDVLRQFHGVLRLRYARLSASTPLRMTAILELNS